MPVPSNLVQIPCQSVTICINNLGTSLPQGIGTTCGTTLQYGRYEVSPWRTIFKKMSIKSTANSKSIYCHFLYNNQLQPIHANPLLQRQSCWIGSQAARNMSPCIHPALLPIKWQSANLTTIGQSKANWTQSWGHSKDISASKERVFHTDNTKCVNQGWLPNITPGHLKTNPSPTHNNN